MKAHVETPTRSVRVPDDLWQAAGVTADREAEKHTKATTHGTWVHAPWDE